jgi:hypothetical protein
LIRVVSNKIDNVDPVDGGHGARKEKTKYTIKTMLATYCHLLARLPS